MVGVIYKHGVSIGPVWLVTWWSLLGLPYQYPVVLSSSCNLFEDHKYPDRQISCRNLIYKWGTWVVVLAMATRVASPC